MIPSELRKEAREALKNNWGKAALITLIYMAITYLMSYLVEKVAILYIVEVVISIPISFGLSIVFMKLKRKENVDSFDFIKEGFVNFKRAWCVWLQVILRMILPIICVFLAAFVILLLTFMSVKPAVIIISGIILWIACIIYIVSRGLLYAPAYLIAFDETNLSAKDCVKKSEEIMTGNRGNLFLLELSFIGWAILGILSLGIGYLWLTPYMQISMVCLYDKIKDNKTKEVSGEAIIDKE